MHSTERERLILAAMAPSGFVTYRELETRMPASPATIRRDLSRLEKAGRIIRVHGGAKLAGEPAGFGKKAFDLHLAGTPFAESINRNVAAKQAIGRAAAALVNPGEGIMLDGGTTTLQMCPHLAGLDCQVLTNSLHIVNALLGQEGTGILVPSGALFREQNIILAPSGEDSMPRFHAPKLFMGAAALGPQGAMQADVVLVAAERRLIDRAEQVILMVDSSKFASSSGAIVCALDEIDVLVTDRLPGGALGESLAAAEVRVIVAD
jgi:DeoR family ulaG and ulaABCDEF operon transcriptional repressor